MLCPWLCSVLACDPGGGPEPTAKPIGLGYARSTHNAVTLGAVWRVHASLQRIRPAPACPAPPVFLPTTPGPSRSAAGTLPSPGLCLPRCDDGQCASGTACVAGVWSRSPSRRPRRGRYLDSLPDAAGFRGRCRLRTTRSCSIRRRRRSTRACSPDLGLDVLRLRNRYGYAGEENLASSGRDRRRGGHSLGRDRPSLDLVEPARGAQGQRGDGLQRQSRHLHAGETADE